jgi:hypothetical protein
MRAATAVAASESDHGAFPRIMFRFKVIDERRKIRESLHNQGRKCQTFKFNHHYHQNHHTPSA